MHGVAARASGRVELVELGPATLGERLAEFVAETGLPNAQTVVGPMTAIPLPLYPTEFPDGRRWAGVRPEVMWHPVMWLPRSPSQRRMIQTTNGVEVEGDEMWAARVLLLLSAAGLHDEDNGTWLDVLAMYNIHVDTPEGRIRVQQWIDGFDDPDLNLIDLDPLAGFPTDPDWAFAAANSSQEVLRPMSHYVCALEFEGDMLVARGAGVTADNVEKTAAPGSAAGVTAEDLSARRQMMPTDPAIMEHVDQLVGLTHDERTRLAREIEFAYAVAHWAESGGYDAAAAAFDSPGQELLLAEPGEFAFEPDDGSSSSSHDWDELGAANAEAWRGVPHSLWREALDTHDARVGGQRPGPRFA